MRAVCTRCSRVLTGWKGSEMLVLSGWSVALALAMLPGTSEALKDGECEGKLGCYFRLATATFKRWRSDGWQSNWGKRGKHSQYSDRKSCTWKHVWWLESFFRLSENPQRGHPKKFLLYKISPTIYRFIFKRIKCKKKCGKVVKVPILTFLI